MLKRSLFTYEFLPVLRSARVVKFLYKHVKTCVGSSSCGKAFTVPTCGAGDSLRELFKKVLINEGRDSFRYSELLGVNSANEIVNKYFSSEEYILDPKALLGLFDTIWEIRGVRVICKSDIRQEFSSISRDIHPFCLLALHFYFKYRTSIQNPDLPTSKEELKLLDRIVQNLDYLGISSSDTPSYAENHLHLGGAFPTETCILNAIDNPKDVTANWSEIPDADRDAVLFDSPAILYNLLGNFSRYLFEENAPSAQEAVVNSRILNCEFSLAFCTNSFFQSFKLRDLKLLTDLKFPLERLANSENENCAFFYYLMFLWSRVFNEKHDIFEAEIAFMLIHIVNLLRSYSIMSASTGLQFFTKYFSSPVRSEKNGMSGFHNIFNSGTGKLQFRSGWTDIKSQFINTENAKREFKRQNPNADLKVNMVYHCVKQAGYKDGDFANKKIRKGISENCKEIMNFAVSYKSIISEFKSILKSGNRDLIFRVLLSCGGRCYDRARRVKLLLRFAEVVANCGIEKMTDEKTRQALADKIAESLSDSNLNLRKINLSSNCYLREIDFMKFLAGIDAAGNEESMPPEIYAPYMRKLAALEEAQLKRARMPEYFPPLKPLRKVFHAGEDFEDIATGLRRIDETVRFLSYRKGDRISHALALGVNPELWYSQKGDVRITKINLLDNLVWLCQQARKIGTPEMCVFIQRYEPHIEWLARELYGENIRGSKHIQSDLYRAWKLRRNCPLEWQRISCRSGTFGFEKSDSSLVPDIQKKFALADAFNLGFCGNLPKTRNSSQCCSNEESIESKLFTVYNFDRGFFKRASKFVELRAVLSPYKARGDMRKIFESDIAVIRAIQDFKINEYADKGIIIETCPSSNIYIGGFDRVENHPIFRWNPPIKRWLKDEYNKSGIRKNIIEVCVNTDDPAIFPTNLENEFKLLRNSAVKLMSPDDNIGEIEEWIERLKQFNEKVFDDNYREAFYVKSDF